MIALRDIRRHLGNVKIGVVEKTINKNYKRRATDERSAQKIVCRLSPKLLEDQRWVAYVLFWKKVELSDDFRFTEARSHLL